MSRLVALVLAFLALAGAAFAQGPPQPIIIQPGSGGSSAIALGITRAQIPATLIGAGKTISVSGYRTANDPGAGAVYSSVGATPGGLEAITDAGGTVFNLVLNGHANVGWFGARHDIGATTISAGDITANPQWRGCYVAGQTWDYVGLQEAIYASLAGNSTAAAPGCTPAAAPLSPPNIVWNAVSANYPLNAEMDIPVGTYGVATTATVVGSHFTWRGGLKGASQIVWTGTQGANTAAGTILHCDACSYWSVYNLSLSNPTPQSYGSQLPLLFFDFDGTYATLNTQQITFYDFVCSVSVNGQCVQVGIIGGAGQGDTVTFVNSIFGGALSDYAVSFVGANALEGTFVGGDVQGFTHDGIQELGGGTFATYDTHFENQSIAFLGSHLPYVTQVSLGGADGHAYSGVATENCDVMHAPRAEDNVLAVATPGACIDVTSGEAVSSDINVWGANSTLFPRGTLVTGAVGGINQTFLLVSTGGQDQPLPITSNTANTITDSTQTWSVNQWAGARALFRFGSNGFTNTCIVASNTATTLTMTTNCISSSGSDKMYAIQMPSGGTTPTWAGTGHNSFGAGSGQGFSTLAASNQVGIGSLIFSNINVGDWVMIPGANVVNPGVLNSPAMVDALYGQVTAKSGSPCPGGQSGLDCLTLSASAVFTLSNTLGYYGTPVMDGSHIWMPLTLDTLAGIGLAHDVIGVHQIQGVGNYIHIPQGFGPLLDTTGGKGPPAGPSGQVSTFFNDAVQGCATPLTPSGTIDVTIPSQECNTLTLAMGGGFGSAGTINAGTTSAGQSQMLHIVVTGDTVNRTITWGSNFSIPPAFTPTFSTGTVSRVWDFYFQSTSAAGWVEVAGPNAVANGTVITTGSPASGNLAKFSGAASVTNGDLSGDCSTSGTLVLTCNGVTRTPARVSGNWYTGFGPTNGFTTASTTTTYFSPLYIAKTVTVANLGALVTTGQAASSIQLAIYADNGSGVPLTAGGPLMSTANIASATSSTNVSGSVTATTLQPGLYWAAIMSNNAGVVVLGVGANTTNWVPALAGASSQNNLLSTASAPISGYSLTGQTFGTWPTSGAPAGVQVVPGVALEYQSQFLPLVFFPAFRRRRAPANDNVDDGAEVA